MIMLTFLIGFVACERQDDDSSVAIYIDQLKSNSFEGSVLPPFSPSDIPALLVYRNSDLVIRDFPQNGISSLRVTECRLGMYVLWTIESIRAVEIKSKYLTGRFPSQTPILALRNATELDLVFDNKSHEDAAKAYNEWWYSSYSVKDKMNIDPLKNTDYRWH